MSAPVPPSEPQPDPAGGAPRRSLWWLAAAVATAGYAADQTTKALAVANLVPGQVRPLLGEVLQLHLIRNSGAAFGLGEGSTWVFTIVSAAVSVAVAVLLRRVRSRGWALALGLLLAGAVGNLTDRLVRAPGVGRGHVVDFLQLPSWPIFNVADSCVVCAAVLIAVLGLRGVRLDGTRERAVTTGPQEAPGA
ncbi:signal peptidase II [Kineococcus glutinatus]|uniref:Lipoprotein signal peptidase n=1 Tax=Kineococcus glutinatus TaxID=1070872 RepID=A0ABP9HMM2_9ACTN